jgi:hypothetical protein
MADDGSLDPNLAIAEHLQEKFDFYLIGLTFTVLGLSVQTAKLDGPAPKDTLELVSWSMLFVSGLAGLYRAERAPSLFRLGSVHVREQDRETRLREASREGAAAVHIGDDGTTRPIDEEIGKSTKAAAYVKNLLDRDYTRLHRIYPLQRWLLAFGFATLLLARGYAVLSKMIAWWLH